MDKCKCGAEPGQFHLRPCPYEECPFCTGTLCLCDCRYIELKIPFFPKRYLHPILCLLGLDIEEDEMTKEQNLMLEALYNCTKGFTSRQWQKWRKILDKKGRIRYRRGKKHDKKSPAKH